MKHGAQRFLRLKPVAALASCQTVYQQDSGSAAKALASLVEVRMVHHTPDYNIPFDFTVFSGQTFLNTGLAHAKASEEYLFDRLKGEQVQHAIATHQ